MCKSYPENNIEPKDDILEAARDLTCISHSPPSLLVVGMRMRHPVTCLPFFTSTSRLASFIYVLQEVFLVKGHINTLCLRQG